MNEAILKFAQEIASHLGNGWTAHIKEDRKNRAYLRSYGIERVILGGDDWYSWEKSKRIEIHGIYPQFGNEPVLSWYGDDKAPTITCAKSRGSEKVTRDIERRFLPKFWPLVEKAEIIVEQYTDDAASRMQNALDIAEVLGEEIDNGRGSDIRAYDTLTVSLGSYKKGVYGSVEVHKDSYSFKIRSCPIDLGLQIAQLIAQHQ